MFTLFSNMQYTFLTYIYTNYFFNFLCVIRSTCWVKEGNYLLKNVYVKIKTYWFKMKTVDTHSLL